MNKTLFPLVFLLSCALLTTHSEGFDLSGLQPPAPYGVFSTFSANTPEKKHSAVAFSVEKSGSPDFLRLSTQLVYGITDNVELGISVPYVENSVSGLEDIAFGLKHRFFGEGKYGPSVAYVLTASPSSGTEDLSTEGRVGGGIALSKRLGPFYGHTNLFYIVPGDSQLEDEIRLSAGVDFSAAHNFRVLGEFLGRKSHFSDEVDDLEFRFGYRFLSRQDMFTTLGVGFDIEDRHPEYRLIASISLLFPHYKRDIKKTRE
jgi:hypothetical protein